LRRFAEESGFRNVPPLHQQIKRQLSQQLFQPMITLFKMLSLIVLIAILIIAFVPICMLVVFSLWVMRLPELTQIESLNIPVLINSKSLQTVTRLN
jgi:hypothetical protein